VGEYRSNGFLISAASSDQNKTFYRSKYSQWQWFARAFSLRSRRYSRAREMAKHTRALYMAKHTRGTRVRIKTLKIQNKNFYSPYSNETFYMKALEYKADFTLIEQIVKSLEDIRVFFRKYMIRKYMIVSVCVSVLKAFDPVEKGSLSGLQWCFSF
jgi:hypothetical protein